MMLVQGITEGGTMAELVPDQRVDQYIARYEAITTKPIIWTVTKSEARTINDALRGATSNVPPA
jgi:hypothetical protein